MGGGGVRMRDRQGERMEERGKRKEEGERMRKKTPMEFDKCYNSCSHSRLENWREGLCVCVLGD